MRQIMPMCTGHYQKCMTSLANRRMRRLNSVCISRRLSGTAIRILGASSLHNGGYKNSSRTRLSELPLRGRLLLLAVCAALAAHAQEKIAEAWDSLLQGTAKGQPDSQPSQNTAGDFLNHFFFES